MKTVFVLLFILCHFIAFSCECFYKSFERLVLEDGFIFAGKIIDKTYNFNRLKDQSDYPPITYTVVVTNVWKGPLTDTVEVSSGQGGGDCGYTFKIDQTYLIWANIQNYGMMVTNSCHRNSLLERSPDIDRLNHFFKGFAYDSVHFTSNEIAAIKKRLGCDTCNIAKTTLFMNDDSKLLTKTKYLEKMNIYGCVDFVAFSRKNLKLLPEEARNGVLILSFMEFYSKIDEKKLVKSLRKIYKKRVKR
jgi:hypothetical protein